MSPAVGVREEEPAAAWGVVVHHAPAEVAITQRPEVKRVDEALQCLYRMSESRLSSSPSVRHTGHVGVAVCVVITNAVVTSAFPASVHSFFESQDR